MGGYLFINLVFVCCLLGSLLQPRDTEPIVVGLLVNAISIIVEIVAISMYWPGVSTTNTSLFSAVMAIINLFGRAITGLVMVLDIRKIDGASENPPKIEQ